MLRSAEEAAIQLRNDLLALSNYSPRECLYLSKDLIGAVVHLSRSQWPVYAGERLLNAEEEAVLQQYRQRLLAYEPIQYILGTASFFNMELQVAAGVLIPRPETEELCSLIVEEQQQKRSAQSSINILDIGSGSGAIALALAQALPGAHCYALEKYEAAYGVLQANIAKYAPEFQPSVVTAIQGDMLQPNEWLHLLPTVDVIVSNPPYVQTSEQAGMHKHVLEYEPHTALFAPAADALFFYKAIASIIEKANLAKRACIYLEVNSALAHETANIMLSNNKIAHAEVLKDLNEKERFVRCCSKE